MRDREDLMRGSRRTFLNLAAGVAALPTMSRLARAQTYPTRPIKLVVAVATVANERQPGRLKP
jgi:hypothetical protein